MQATSPIRVLVVEDEAIVNEFIQNQLINLGYEIAGCAFDGPESVALTCRLRPDVVLMDLQMIEPQTGRDDRLAGLLAARAIQARCPTPVILLTAYESRELVEQASAAGVGAYLVKPADDSELQRAITIALARFDDLRELRRLNTNLQARNEELDAYGHTVAHDLKDPLAIIIGFAEALAEDDETTSSEGSRDRLLEIAQSGRKMHDIVDELLLLASVRKADSIRVAPLDMGDIVIEAQKRLAHEISACQAEVTLPESWPVAVGHRQWVEEVWVNYLSNAIKYGGSPPRAELGAGPQPPLPEGTVRFWVRDNGPGLSPEEQTRLFTPFERLEQVRAKGNGLGLSIVQRIVKRMGGQVGVESEPGAGSIFWFTLPSG